MDHIHTISSSSIFLIMFNEPVNYMKGKKTLNKICLSLFTETTFSTSLKMSTLIKKQKGSQNCEAARICWELTAFLVR